MTTQRRQLYQSSNGDHWYLCRGRGGKLVVLHDSNRASGGTLSQIDVGTFLTEGNNGPEHQALRQLIGELVDPGHLPKTGR
jgi:hypothetical protein